MIASIFIIVVSLVMFVYWFRYTCLLILSTRSNRQYAEQMANANQLSFLRARDLLAEAQPTEIGNQSLDTLRKSLDRDYTLMVYLLRHAAHHSDNQTFEQHLLRLDFQLMRMWYGISKLLWRSQARHALLEMTSIVHHLASTMGERVAVSRRA